MPEFIPGLQLSDLFYHEAVQPTLDAHFPGLGYSAALIGNGSEVLGFDTAMSSDHHWGPRVLIFLNEPEYERYSQTIHETLANELPFTFRDFPTHFTIPNPDDNGVQLLQETTSRPINHRVQIILETILIIQLPITNQCHLPWPDPSCRKHSSGSRQVEGWGVRSRLKRRRRTGFTKFGPRL